MKCIFINLTRSVDVIYAVKSEKFGIDYNDDNTSEICPRERKWMSGECINWDKLATGTGSSTNDIFIALKKFDEGKNLKR